MLTETLLGALGALIILLFVFGTLPAVAMPLAMAAASILTTFLCVFGLTYVTDVSIIVQFLVALVGLGVAIDYALADDLPLPRGTRTRARDPTKRSLRR